MPRAATTSDVFNAIAEPVRRDIIAALANSGDTGRAVGTLVAMLRLPQPAVSKHLAVLLTVGIVAVARQGKHRLYRLNAEKLKPVHDWVQTYERLWDHQLLRIKERAERKARERSRNVGSLHS